MEAGKSAEHIINVRNLRRDGELKFGVELAGRRLAGRLDALCVYRAIVIELKPLSNITKKSLGKRHRHFLLQLVAYALLVEEVLKVPSPRGYLVGSKGAIEVRISPSLKAQVLSMLGEVEMVLSGKLPKEIGARIGKCKCCEFRRWCKPPLRT